MFFLLFNTALLCLLVLIMQTAFQNQSVLLLCSEDDSDIKIAGSAAYSEPSEVDDADAEALAFEKEKQNGNIEKAKSLGIELSYIFIDKKSLATFGIDNEAETDAIRLQRYILLAFTITYIVDNSVDSSIVAQTVKNSFWDSVKKTSPNVYEIIAESAAFSLYCLCARNAENIRNCLSATFAKLCGKENDELYIRFGRSLFLYFTNAVSNLVLKANFTY